LGLAELALALAEPAQDLVQEWDLAQAPAWVKDLTGELANGSDSQRTLTLAANQ
jgi:hypothetical protein